MTRCENCRAFSKTSKVTSLLHGHITVEIGAQNKEIHMDHDSFTCGRHDSSELVSKVLGHEELQIDMCGQVMINVQFVKSMCEARSSSVPGCHKRVLSNVEVEKHSMPQ